MIQDFPEGVGGGHQPIIWPKFPENCMKMKKMAFVEHFIEQ